MTRAIKLNIVEYDKALIHVDGCHDYIKSLTAQLELLLKAPSYVLRREELNCISITSKIYIMLIVVVT